MPTYTIRVFEDDYVAALADAQKLTGRKTVSGAIRALVMDARASHEIIGRLTREKAKLDNQLKRLHSSIERYTQAQEGLFQIVRQKNQ